MQFQQQRFRRNQVYQGRIQTGSKGSHKPVKQFRFLKQSIKINYQIPDYKKILTFSCKIKKISQKIERLVASTLPISTASLA